MRISDWSSDVCSSDLPVSDARSHGGPEIGHYEGFLDLVECLLVERRLCKNAGQIFAEAIGCTTESAEQALVPAFVVHSFSSAIRRSCSTPLMVTCIISPGTCGLSNRTGAKFSAWPERPSRSISTLCLEPRSEEHTSEHTSELQSPMRLSYAVC